MPPKIRTIVRRLEREGWLCDRIGKHMIFVHPRLPGARIVLPKHLNDEISVGVYLEIRKKAGWR